MSIASIGISGYASSTESIECSGGIDEIDFEVSELEYEWMQ